jgi:hypothetical protein
MRQIGFPLMHATPLHRWNLRRKLTARGAAQQPIGKSSIIRASHLIPSGRVHSNAQRPSVMAAINS